MKNNNLIVTSATMAQKMIGAKNPFMLILNKGENIGNAIIAMATKAELKSAAFFGIGALQDLKLSFFNIATKQYQHQIFTGVYELISFNGNLTKMQGKYIAHMHAAISDCNYNLYAGHLSDATVGVTAEITIIPFDLSIERKIDSEFNLNLINV